MSWNRLKERIALGLLLPGLLGAPAVLAQHNSNILVSATNIATGSLTIGSTGTNNSLQVTAGGGVTTTGTGVIGFGSTASNNYFIVSDSGSAWNISSYMEVGENGPANQGTISNGGSVSVGNSIWVGYGNHDNSLTIASGGTLTNTTASSIGHVAGVSNNSVTVTGSGSVWKSLNNLDVGFNGTRNQLTIADGGVVDTLTLVAGLGSASSSNVILVTGAGSRANASSYIEVGESGSGNFLVISNQGHVASGVGGFWVGFGGDNNQMTIASGGSLTNSLLAKIGDTATAEGNRATVTGTGSVWAATSGLQVGSSGIGNQLIITNGGQLNTTFLIAGFLGSGTNNSILVTSPGSKIVASSYIEIGESGSANSMVISNQAEVTSAAGGFWVGFGGDDNRLAVADGGSLSTSSGTAIGGAAGADGNQATVTGSNSLWTVGGVFTVGSGGNNNELVVTNGGRVVVNGTATAGTSGTGNAIRVLDGGLLEASSLAVGAGAGNTISNVGGTYQFTVASPTITDGKVFVTDGTVSFRGIVNASTAPVADLTYSGDNTFQLNSATNTSVASYTFNTGTPTNYYRLSLRNGRFQATTTIIGANGELVGNGVVASANVTNHGVIAPGFSPGILEFTGNVHLGITSSLDMELAGTAASSYDQVNVASNLTFDGTLNVTLIDAFNPSGGDSFDLFDFDSASGTFDALNLPTLGGGLFWDTSDLYSLGTISVSAVPEPSAALLAVGAWAMLWRRRSRG